MTAIYLDLFYHTVFIFVIIYSFLVGVSGTYFFTSAKGIAMFFSLIVVMYIGNFPLELSPDKESYLLGFLRHSIEREYDFLFGYYNYFIGTFTNNPTVFFMLTALIYVYNHYIFANRLMPKGVLFMMIMFFTSLLFVNYGVNTLRSGLALSFVLIGITAWDKSKIKSILIFCISIGIHMSSALPVISFIISYYFIRKSKYLVFAWLISVLTSYLYGATIKVFLAGLISSDSRVLGFLESTQEYDVGFRLDFIVYSLVPIIVGSYYIMKLKYKDKLYTTIFNTYIISNIFWIMIIEIPFSDRFAYLSWFLMPIILIYPTFKRNAEINSRIAIQRASLILFAYSFFTYIMKFFLK